MALENTINAELEIKRTKSARDMSDRAQQEQDNRARLRDSVVQLREPAETHAKSPALATARSFKIGENPGFPYVPDGPGNPHSGNMSPKAYEEFKSALKEAAAKPDMAAREAATGRAAKVVAKDYALKHGLAHGPEGVKAEVLHAARAQATFAARELGKHVGMDPVSSSVVGYSLERALEHQGFRVFANHAIDKVGNYMQSAASTASATGIRAELDASFNKSMNWMAEHGVSRDRLKTAVSEHSGKIFAILAVAEHPEAVQKVAYMAARSEGALDLLYKAASDKEIRHAVGTVTQAVGEQVAIVNKGAGSVAVVAGAMLKGDSMADVSREVFRASLTVVGGVAGAAMVGAGTMGFGAVAGGVVGAEVGSIAADKILSTYDKMVGNEPEKQKALVSQSQLDEGKKVLESAKSGAEQAKGSQEKVSEIQREFSMGRQQ